MKVARSPDELAWARRAVALGTFDGIHAGHRRVIDAAVATGLRTAVVTFHPHPRSALGEHVELISTLERRLELFAESGVDDVLVLHFTQALARVEPEQFALDVLDPIGAEIVVAGTNFRFGLDRRGDLELLSGLGYCGRPVPLVEGVSSSAIRKLVGAGEVERAAPLLGRPVEVEGVVVRGDARGNTLGYPTANLDVEPDVLVPAFGIYAGAVARLVPPSRSGRTHSTTGRSGGSKRSCSTGMETCTDAAWSSSYGVDSGTSSRSAAS